MSFPRLSSLRLHDPCDVLVLLQLPHDSVTPGDVLKQLREIRPRVFRPRIVGIKVDRLKDDVVRALRDGQLRLARLVVALRLPEQVLDLAAVAEVGPVARAAEEVDGDRFRLRRRVQVLLLELAGQDVEQLGVVKVFEAEGVLDREAA